MTDKKPKADGDDNLIDPALKDRTSATATSPQPVNPAGATRKENENAANRDADGPRKRAEEGL
jgi:hypothetical protein